MPILSLKLSSGLIPENNLETYWIENKKLELTSLTHVF